MTPGDSSQASAATMKVALVGAGAPFQLTDFPVPDEAAPGAAIVDVAYCGVCGSDVSAFRSNGPYPPFLSGHEFTGTVRSVGHGVVELAVGDRVVGGVPPACGQCAVCRAGHHGRCERITALPFGLDPLAPPHGAFARSVQYPADYLVRVPDELDDVAAAMVEPATVALHAVRRTPPALGDSVVVLGAGPVGLFALQLLKSAGAGRVVVVEPQARRRQLALDLGATDVVEPGDGASALVSGMTDGLGADLVFDCVGSESALESAIDLTRAGGTVMMVGVSSRPITVSPLSWMVKEITLSTSLAHLNHEFSITMDLMTSGRLVTAPLLDKVVDLDGLEDLVGDLAAGKDFVKVLVDPRA